MIVAGVTKRPGSHLMVTPSKTAVESRPLSRCLKAMAGMEGEDIMEAGGALGFCGVRVVSASQSPRVDLSRPVSGLPLTRVDQERVRRSAGTSASQGLPPPPLTNPQDNGESP